jgi:hypothetical protein
LKTLSSSPVSPSSAMRFGETRTGFTESDAQPFYRMDAPETGDGETRQVIVFRLVPVGTILREPIDQLQLPGTIELAEIEAAVGGSAAAQVSEIPVEEQHSEEVLVNPAVSEYSAIRREQTLVLAYATYLEKRGSTVTRLRIHPPGEAKPLLSDVYDATRNNLVEAKGTGTRESVRMGIGQLADYGRFAPPGAARAVLLPDRPRADLEELLSSQGIACVWVSETGFSDNAGGRFSQA